MDAINLKYLRESRFIAWILNLTLLVFIVGANWGAFWAEAKVVEEIALLRDSQENSNHIALIVILLIANVYFVSRLVIVNRYLNAPWDRMREISLSLPGFVGITSQGGQLVIESCSNDFSELLGTDKNLVGHQVMLTLFSKEYVQLGAMAHENLFKTLHAMIGEPDAFFRSQIQKLPQHILIPRSGEDDRVLELTYEANQLKRFRQKDEVRGIIIGLKDITEKVRLEKEAAQQQAILDKQREINTQQRLAMQTMLDNIHQGVFTINGKQVIEPNYSVHLTTILEADDIAGKKLTEVLFQNSQLSSDQVNQIREALNLIIGGDSIAVALNSHVLIGQFEKRKIDDTLATYALDWVPIYNQDDRVGKMMVTVRDITQTLALESEVAQQKRESEIVLEILAIPQNQFNHFLRDAFDLLDQCQSLLEAQTEKDLNGIAALLRCLHTIKGNARTNNFTYLTPLVHDIEQDYVMLRDSEETPWEQSQRLSQIESIRTVVKEYETLNRVKLGRGQQENEIQEAHYRLPMSQANEWLTYLKKSKEPSIGKVRHELEVLGSSRLPDFLAAIKDTLPELAKALDKPVPQVLIEDNGINIKTPYVNTLKNIFMHIFRNTMDHGIGHHDEVKIHLEAAMHQGQLCLTYYDNGQGLNLFEIQKRAFEKAIIRKEDKLSPQETANLIFVSGFSTAKQVTDISGRGVGMDAIKKMIEEMGGSVELKLEGTPDSLGLCPFQLMITLPKKCGVLREIVSGRNHAEFRSS